MRQALCMSGPELAKRMGRSSSRVGQIEEAEVNGSILVSTLRRAAEAMNCRLVYAFVPTEPLEQMVIRQAHIKAAMRLSIADPDALEESEDKWDRLRLDQLEDLTFEYVDRQGLWS
jgi:predicted DNA-binding mobile mystery protein A